MWEMVVYVHLGGKSSREFKYGCGKVCGVVNISALGARGDGSFGYKESVWLVIGGATDKARDVHENSHDENRGTRVENKLEARNIESLVVPDTPPPF
nr:hypothetical protein [Tanacetum cinerariifolium]